MIPKVSVIVPVYNVSKYIERCARSLFSQSLLNMEFIFVDDCSPDNSIDILKEVIHDFPDRKDKIKIIHHTSNKGLTSARNTGFQNATGMYVAHCDSDDWVDTKMYEEMYNMAERLDADIVYCDMVMVYRNGNEIYNTSPCSIDKKTMLRKYIASVWTSVVNMIIKKDLYVRNSLQSPVHLTYCEDFWLSVRLFYFAETIAKIEKPFYFYNRLNESSIIHKLNHKTELEERKANIETIEFFRSVGVLEDYHKEMCWRVLKSTCDSIYHDDRYMEFIQTYPYAHNYIWSCPYVNIKSKIFMWMLSHHLGLLAKPLLKLRRSLGR